jgi:hypothetical protein
LKRQKIAMVERLLDNDFMLEIEGGDKFVYFDSGVPKEEGPYTTCIFVHGLFFNHRTYILNPDLPTNHNSKLTFLAGV